MKLLLVLFFSTLFVLLVFGQSDPSKLCDKIPDYNPCNHVGIDPDLFKCSNNSICSCKDSKPYCRCNSYIDEWFIGGDCHQKWTTVTFALVASLPGLGLAIVVGLIVFVLRKPKKGKKDRGPRENKKAAINQEEDDMFKNIVFASDVKRPNSRPPPESTRPPTGTVPMTVMPDHDYRMPPPTDRTSTNRPFNQPYSQHRDIHPSQDRLSMGRPPTTSNSYGPGMGQVLSNPYAISHKTSPGRPPYEGQSPSPDYNYRPKQPPVNGMKVMMSDYHHSSPPPPQPFPHPNYNPPAPSIRDQRWMEDTEKPRR